MKRAVYGKHFEMAAVKHEQSTGQSIKDAAEGTGINGTILRRWVNECHGYGESAFPGHGNALFNTTKTGKAVTR